MKLLQDMALFVEVVKTRSFRVAALNLGMPNSTLSRRIAGLEKAVGLRLFHRTTRKVEPTEAGIAYYEACRRIVDEAAIAHEQLGQRLSKPSGLLRISLPADFASTFLAPLFTEFAVLYPEITFHLDLTPRNVDLVSESFDLAIRVGEPADSALIARPLIRMEPGLYASPLYLAAHGIPKSPGDLSEHECLDFPGAHAWHLRCGADHREIHVHGRFRANSGGMLRRLAALGNGITLLPEPFVEAEIAAGQLVRILPEWKGQAVTVNAMTETRLLPAKSQRLIEFLKNRLSNGVTATTP